jgi:phosphoribosylanthranilate isomerase
VSLFVKICGVTREEDITLARTLGASAIGINFWPQSPRFVGSLARARALAEAAAGLQVVGVFVNQPAAEIDAALAFLTLVQLHGDESPAFAARFQDRYIRAVRVRGEADLAEIDRHRCPFYLLDAAAPGYGGGGQTFDWTLAARAASQHKIVLAGGLTPANVRAAVHAVRPYGVDVASGVESSPGVKDAAKLRSFIEEANAA